jgi:stage II sporulation protein P
LPEDTALIRVSNLCDYPVDLEALLLSRLEWELPLGKPAVLIIHSHATESYTQTAQFPYESSAAYRTLDTHCNMVRVGEALKKALEEKGIQVLHDRTLHDYPSYTAAYINSRETVQAYLREYPSLCLVIDLHRDAADTTGGQLKTEAVVDGTEAAQLMLVVGTDAGGRSHASWEQNLSLAVKLHAQLEKLYPGICRPISFRKERFNQDLSPGAVLIEVGAAGDTLEKALAAVEALAKGIAALLTTGSTS